MSKINEIVKAHQFFCRKSQHYIMGNWNSYERWFSKWDRKNGGYHSTNFNQRKWRYITGFIPAYLKFMYLSVLTPKQTHETNK